MASRILAQILMAGGTVIARAAVQAYKQAIINGQRAGVTPESIKSATQKAQLSLEEARKILGVDASTSMEEAMRKFNHLFKVNGEKGSFYLQSKVYRAKERLDQETEEADSEGKSREKVETDKQ